MRSAMSSDSLTIVATVVKMECNLQYITALEFMYWTKLYPIDLYLDWTSLKILNKLPHFTSFKKHMKPFSTCCKNLADIFHNLTEPGSCKEFITFCIHFFPVVLSKLNSWRFNNKSSELKKTLLAAFEIVFAISLAASIFLRVINAGLLAIAWPISWALLASPWNP